MYVCTCTNRVGPHSFFFSSASTFVSISWNSGGTRRGGGVFARGDGIQHVHVSQHVALVNKNRFSFLFYLLAVCLVEVIGYCMYT